MCVIKLFYFQLFHCWTSNKVFFFFFFKKSLICYSRIQATTGLGPSEKSCGSVKFNSQAPFAQELMALLQEEKLAMFWVGKGAVKTTTVYLKCANTFVEDCMFPRPGLNQVFFLLKKWGIGK